MEDMLFYLEAMQQFSKTPVLFPESLKPAAPPREHFRPTFGRFHVKGPRKKVYVKKWIFFNEMWKVIGQIDNFDSFLNNSYNLGMFLAKKSKIPKNDCFEKMKN